MSQNRRDFLTQSAAVAGLAVLGSTSIASAAAKKPWFEISLAQWSLHKALRAGKLDNLDYARVTKEEFGISGVEYVNQFFKDKATDEKYLGEMKKRASDYGVTSLLIMCDGEGNLGDPDDKKRTQAVENHYKWVDAAKFLGCHSIRVNAGSRGTYEEQMKLAADGLSRLTAYGAKQDINVIVENHGGLSSDGEWLAGVMKKVGHDHCGTLPDFGNFFINRGKNSVEWFSNYEGTKLLMPYAKGVSAKTHEFSEHYPLSTFQTRYQEKGVIIETDYMKIMQIVKDANYTGFVGIEYEGSELDEYAGIRRSKKLLEDVREKLG
ncbi:MAG: sugar phosphate isomerase/epimerase [Planctomycetaceae bacterium]|jgi:L-ribulose-5-phosphate 3-epimerase|nr:sugar phosphate isomerase/epimerase [Planctomycetaceae bacterium]